MNYRVWNQPQPLIVYSESAEWSSGICDCCDDMKDCCCGFWCLPCFACKTTKAFGQCLCLPLLDLCNCINPIAMSMRTFVRHQYDIGGNLLDDFLLSTCCAACVWCQISREMKKRTLPAMLSDIIQR